jgi:predicted phosphodiesterase
VEAINVTYTNCNVGTKQNVRFIPLSDAHKGSREHDSDTYYDAIDRIKNSRYTYTIGNGDLCEFGTKVSPGMSIFEQQLSNESQLDEVIDDLYPIRGKILGLKPGNHEKRIDKLTGISATGYIARALGVPLLADSSYHIIELNNNVRWKIFATHGRSGATTIRGKETAIKRLREHHEDADIYIMGHVHRLAHLEEYKYAIGIDENTNEQVLKKYRLGDFIFAGHFLKYINSYAQEANMKPEPPGYPILTFKPDGTFDVDLVYGNLELVQNRLVQEKY